MAISDVAGLTSILFFLFLSVTLIVMRWFRHKETLAMIEKGVMPPRMVKELTKNRNGKAFLSWGIIVSALGLSMVCLILPLFAFRGLSRVSSSEESVLSIGILVLPSLLALFVGVGLIIVYYVTRSTTNGNHDESWEEFDDVEKFDDVAELEQSDIKVSPER